MQSIAVGSNRNHRSNSLTIVQGGGVIYNGVLIAGAEDVVGVAAWGEDAAWVTRSGDAYQMMLEPVDDDDGSPARGARPRRVAYAAPEQIFFATGDRTVRVVSVGQSHMLAATGSGEVLCKGINRCCCLGEHASGGPVASLVPFPGAAGIGRATSVVAGCCTSAVLFRDGTAWSIGMNTDGQLGVGDQHNRRALTRMPFLSSVVQLSMHTHCAAVTRDGDLFTWGRNAQFQCGSGDMVVSKTPQERRGLWSPHGVSSAECGRMHTLIVDMVGRVFQAGRCVVNIEYHHTTFKELLNVPVKILAVATGDNRLVCLDSDGGLYEGGFVTGGFSAAPVWVLDIQSNRVPPPMTLQVSGVSLDPRAVCPVRKLAFAMCLHVRLGAESACRVLTDDVAFRVMLVTGSSVNETEDRRMGKHIGCSRTH